MNVPMNHVLLVLAKQSTSGGGQRVQPISGNQYKRQDVRFRSPKLTETPGLGVPLYTCQGRKN